MSTNRNTNTNGAMELDNSLLNVSNQQLHFYLWVSHGANVSSVHNFYPIETKFLALTFYSRPFERIDKDYFDEITDWNFCKLVTGTCPIIPIIDKTTNKKDVYLPPLIFGVLDSDEGTPEKDAMGLYYVIIEKTGFDKKDACKLVHQEQIYNWDNFIKMFGNKVPITYSTIFKLVLDDCSKKNLNPEEVCLGIFSCQSKFPTYAKEYDQTNIIDLIPRNVDDIEQAEILNATQLERKYASITVIPFEEVITGWDGLIDVKNQGCALNVLSYYNLIPETSAREQTVCLSIKGTSIFKIVDYINDYLKNEKGMDNTYAVVRYEKAEGLSKVLQILSAIKYKDEVSLVVIIKMYEEKYKSGTNILSQIGHTVSLAKMNDKIYYSDPQSKIETDLLVLDGKLLSEAIDSLYPKNSFKYIDCIYTVETSLDKFSYGTPVVPASSLRSNIVVRTPETRHGGNRNTTHSKNSKNSKNNKNSKSNKASKSNKKNNKSNKARKPNKKNKALKNKSSKKNKTLKNKNLDNFENLMINIDKKNKVNSLIKLE